MVVPIGARLRRIRPAQWLPVCAIEEWGMDWVFEVACTGPADRGEAARDWFIAGARGWAGVRGLTTLDLYTPTEDRAHDPFNDDGAGPLLVAMAAFATRDALKAAVEAAPLGASLATSPAGLAFTGSSFERRFYPVGDETKPTPLTARFSYLVRYHKPAEDEAAFIRNYVDTHPPTLAQLPGIRSVMCFFPQGLVAPGVKPADYMIGNEVAFDDVTAFNLAMQSEVRQELRRHYREFPPFSGRNTHFPMNRTRMVG
jgi:uncharacterized protein (TIGR02118 family)